MPGPVYLSGTEVNLRTIEKEDIDFLQEALTDPEMWEGFGAPGPRNRMEMEERFEEQNTGTALLICRDESPVGGVRLVDVDERWGNAELTCYVVPDSQGRGVASEACRLLIDYGFEYLPISKIVARTFETNQASQKLVESLGFTQEGTLREHVYHGGDFIDFEIYGLLEDEWNSNR